MYLKLDLMSGFVSRRDSHTTTRLARSESIFSLQGKQEMLQHVYIPWAGLSPFPSRDSSWQCPIQVAEAGSIPASLPLSFKPPLVLLFFLLSAKRVFSPPASCFLASLTISYCQRQECRLPFHADWDPIVSPKGSLVQDTAQLTTAPWQSPCTACEIVD